MVTNYSDNPQVPSYQSYALNPDQLIAGPFPEVTLDNSPVIAQSAALKRGSVLGVITASGKYLLSASAASDGSQNPAAILLDDVDASAADVTGAAVAITGEFNARKLILGTGTTLAAAIAALRTHSIFVKQSVSAADPT